jgi:phospholipid transport system substrate-binding protein
MTNTPISRPIRALLFAFTFAFLVGPLTASPALADDAEAEGAPTSDASDPDVPNLDARKPVVTLEDTLLAVMKEADTLGFEGRLRKILPVVEETFDLEFMAKTCIGRVWKDLSPDIQARWVEVFTRYTTTKLADQFDAYSGQRFVLKGERPASRGTLIVLSSVERPGKDDVRLDFRVRPMGDVWRIIDIYGKGKVSEVALRRSEYASILEQSGIEGLIASVDELSDRTASKSSS